MKLLVVGDVHGDIKFAQDAVDVALRNNINKIVQVGDFGIWDHTSKGISFLDNLHTYSSLFKVTWYFLPGNHENYDRLENYEKVDDRHTDGFVKIRDNIWYTRKVNMWEWNQRRIAVVGGAYSIDKAYRIQGSSWWPQETLQPKEFNEVMEYPFVDILFTHDCPTWAKFGQRLKVDPESHNHRKIMDRVHDNLLPKVWMHGHYHSHMEYTDDRAITSVYGLECNDQAMPYPAFYNMAILDLNSLKVTWPLAT